MNNLEFFEQNTKNNNCIVVPWGIYDCYDGKRFLKDSNKARCRRFGITNNSVGAVYKILDRYKNIEELLSIKVSEQKKLCFSEYKKWIDILLEEDNIVYSFMGLNALKQWYNDNPKTKADKIIVGKLLTSKPISIFHSSGGVYYDNK